MAKGFIYRKLFQRGVYSIEEITKAIEPIAKSYGVERVYLFGSYARGEADRYSDIDLFVYPGRVRGMELGGLM